MKKSFYIYSSGTLQRRDNSLVLISKNNVEYIPIYQVDVIYVFGSINLNKTVIQILNEYSISLLFFSYYGRYIGSYRPKQQLIGYISKQQFALYENPSKLFIYQKEMIYTSIHNMISVIKYYQKKRSIVFTQVHELENLQEEVKNLEYDNHSILMILEARSKQIYYSSFNHILLNKDFSFSTRTNYPPKDELNALMSYGYSLLYGIIETMLYCSHLLPHFGLIHGLSKPENGLKYDIGDIFKPVLIDRLIFRLINKKQITINNFERKNEGTYLSKEGCIIFINAFDEELRNTIDIKGRKLSYKSIVKREIYAIEKSLIGKKQYQGYKMEW